MYQLLKGEFDYCKDISWNDVINKIDYDCVHDEYKSLIKEKTAPTYILESLYLPGNLQKVFDRVCSEYETTKLHVYTSLGAGSPTFGRHKDPLDVLLIQVFGKVSYELDDNKQNGPVSLTLPETIDLNPGDGILIKKGIYHNPIIKEPRITLSFSWW
tara:strand:+ start:200 stop:670 length:471 start_codon:yes stop_codon:yes gene_type:complete